MKTSTMELGHIILCVAAVLCSVNASSKYGRTCRDIACRPTETCVMASDACAWYQKLLFQDGNSCGSYPKCQGSYNSYPSNNYGNNGNNFNNAPYPTNSYGGNRPYPTNSYGGNQPYPTNSYGGNQPWNNPSPTSGQKQPDYPRSQSNYYPQNPQNPQQYPSNVDYRFGNQPNNIYQRTTTREPSLIEQFLYGPSGRRDNSNGLPKGLTTRVPYAPAPTPQYPMYPQSPQNYYPQNPNNYPNGYDSRYGNTTPGRFNQYPGGQTNYRETTPSPGLYPKLPQAPSAPVAPYPNQPFPNSNAAGSNYPTQGNTGTNFSQQPTWANPYYQNQNQNQNQYQNRNYNYQNAYPTQSSQPQTTKKAESFGWSVGQH